MGKTDFLSNAVPLESREGQVTLVALVMMLYVIALFLAVAIHEILGHGMTTIILGGDFYAFYLSPGSGFISFYMPDSVSALEVAAIYLAGISVQIIVGLAVLLYVFPRIKNFLVGLFTLIFSVAMLVHPSIYLFMGYFYHGGDTKYAVALLGIRPDIFMVAGLIMTGIFSMWISIAALNFIGSFLNVEDEKTRNKILLIFWLPPLLVGGFGTLVSVSFTPVNEQSYAAVNAIIMILFLGMVIYLVPNFVEPIRTRKYWLSLKSVFSVLVILVVILSFWVGAFGVSQSDAHGILLHEPPVEVEHHYSDYSIGNAELFVYHNGTARVSIILRNQIENRSSLDRQIYHTFDRRPDWDRYIQRSRYIVITMFDLQREVGENLSFSTSFGTVRALGVEDELGRVCTTYVEFYNPGTRQLSPHSGVGDGMTLHFTDPWQNLNPKGYLDEVRVSCGDDLRIDGAYGENEYYDTIDYNRGNQFNNSIGWKNINLQNSPASYTVIFTDPITVPERT